MKKSPVIIAFLLLVAGCATTENPPEAVRFQNATEAGAARIVGQFKKGMGWTTPPRTLLVKAIDEKIVGSAGVSEDTVVAVTPGKHTILLYYREGGASAQTKLVLDAEADRTYVVAAFKERSDPLVQFWISDKATGRPVTKVANERTYSEQPGETFLPIFIPVK